MIVLVRRVVVVDALIAEDSCKELGPPTDVLVSSLDLGVLLVKSEKGLHDVEGITAEEAACG